MLPSFLLRRTLLATLPTPLQSIKTLRTRLANNSKRRKKRPKTVVRKSLDQPTLVRLQQKALRSVDLLLKLLALET